MTLLITHAGVAGSMGVTGARGEHWHAGCDWTAPAISAFAGHATALVIGQTETTSTELLSKDAVLLL